MKTDFSLIHLDVVFPIQSSEFIKSLSFESNLKEKNARKNQNIFIFHLEIDFYDIKKKYSI